ncbi:ankyrin repeat-containing protein [Cyclospora cayetanensis]|uniref:Ankyrin repeat-containing protein n=1 Tax=Cyclospora cayetanensis TaxID=88456 RepID=A0A1D3CRZ6_9EIME|nr:ankyrin repeat-containing protein [Cyclospora cayetanensis]
MCPWALLPVCASMCPQHLRTSLLPGASARRDSSGRLSGCPKQPIWQPQQPKEAKQRQDLQQQLRQLKQKTEFGGATVEQTILPTPEAEALGDLDIEPPLDICPSEGGFPPPLLQQTVVMADADASQATPSTTPDLYQQLPQPHFCLPPPAPDGEHGRSASQKSETGRTDIVRLCLERGASPAAADSIGRTPLHYAAATGVAQAVSLLLKYAAHPKQQQQEGQGAAALVDISDKKRWTPLLIAVTKEHVPCTAHLDSGSSNSTGGGGVPLQTWSSAIHFAAIKGNIPISELLLQHGSTVNDLDSDARPPLHYAACRDKPDYVRWLLQHGARPDLLDINQRGAFHAVATRGNLQVVQLLLEATPPKTLLRLLLQQDAWGLTAEALAKLHGHRSMHLLLKSYREAVESQVGLEEAAAAATSRAVGAQGLSDAAVSATIAEVLATGLQELKKAKLVRAVQRLGTLPCLKAYQQTLMIQALGGMLVADGSRRKTAGGVFFTVLGEFAKEGQISREDLAFVNAEDCETRKAVKRRTRHSLETATRGPVPARVSEDTAAVAAAQQQQHLQQAALAAAGFPPALKPQNNQQQQRRSAAAFSTKSKRQQALNCAAAEGAAVDIPMESTSLAFYASKGANPCALLHSCTFDAPEMITKANAYRLLGTGAAGGAQWRKGGCAGKANIFLNSWLQPHRRFIAVVSPVGKGSLNGALKGSKEEPSVLRAKE